jgi:hypothetical protein
MDETKIEWRKTEPGFALKKKPQILTIPKQNYLAIDGVGDPNLPDFQSRIQALYPVAYTIRMSQKKQWLIPGYQPYTVYPLEGRWGIQTQYLNEPVMQKKHFAYTIRIKQPDFVTTAVAQTALQMAQPKIEPALFEQVRFEQQPAQLVAQILHIGSFDDEPATFSILEQFLAENGYQRTEKEHTEIYMSDFRRVPEAKRKTILRVAIQKINTP